MFSDNLFIHLTKMYGAPVIYICQVPYEILEIYEDE